MSVPYWVQDQIFYQIFPDRFANGDQGLDPSNVQSWGAEPTVHGFQGGDLRGIVEKFDYLLDLGITALYLNPIFQSSANHRYHTVDYYKIDPRLGTMDDFKALLDVAHSNQVKVIIDGVFNHSGRGLFQFNDILENEEESGYKDWFHIHKFPIDAYSDGEAQDFAAWWGIKDLPKFNTDTPAVRQFIFDVARYWVEQGIDGWRLDVPAEIDDDSFWAEFRQVAKTANPDAYIVGEIWEADPRWVNDTHFDAVMNYPVRNAVLDILLNGGEMSVLADSLEHLLNVYPRENVYAMYVPLGSHDTRRLLTRVGEDVDKAKLAFALQFAFPGAPAIYYGDEIGITGDKDPQNRRAFPWDENQWNHDLHGWTKKLISARKTSKALRRGDYQRIVASNDMRYYAFARCLGEEKVLVVLNATEKSCKLTIPVNELDWEEGQKVQDMLSKARYRVADEGVTVDLPPWGAVYLGH